MKVRLKMAVGLLSGLALSAAWLIAPWGPSALGGEEAAQPTANKAGPGKDLKKLLRDADPRPGPYPEDPLSSQAEKNYLGSGAYRWLNVSLEATVREHERFGARPTIGSRNLAICVTAMYDAWAAYDAKAVGTRLGGKLRRPARERTIANKDKAIGYAVTRV